MSKILVDEKYLENINDCLKRIQRRDSSAVDELYDLFNAKLYYIGYNILQHKQDTEDFVQDFWSKIESISDKWIFKIYGYNYLRKSAKNLALDNYRKLKKERERAHSIESLEWINSSETNNDLVVMIENKDLLDKALKSLSEIEERIIIDNMYLDKSIREISKELHMSKSTVGWILVQAKEKIKKFFE